MSGAPILIAGTGGGTLGAFSGVQWGAVVRSNGEIWQFVSEPAPNDQVLGAYLLDSDGAAYTLISSPTDGINSINAPMYWDGSSNKVTFLSGDQITPAGLYEFDLDARTWSSIFATTNSQFFGASALWRIAGGWVAVGAVGGDFVVYQAAVYEDGTGAWRDPINISTLAQLHEEALPHGFLSSFFGLTSIIDATGILHTICWSGNTNHFYYQQFNTNDDTLGVFQVFAGQDGSPQDLCADANASTMVILGDSLIWGIRRNADGGAGVGAYQIPAIYVGTPLSAPVWTESGTIDPNAFVSVASDPTPQPQSATSFGNLFYVGGVLYSVYMRNVFTDPSVFTSYDGQIFVSQTSASGFLTGWTSANFYNPSVIPAPFPAGHDAEGFTPLLAFQGGAIIGASVDYTDTTADGPEQRYWIGMGAVRRFGNIFGYPVNAIR